MIAANGNKAAEGRKAYKDGLTRDDNPYPKGSTKYWQWSSGWLEERASRPIPAAISEAQKEEAK